MSDFFSNAWSIYVAIATVVGIVACLVLLFVAARRKVMAGDNTTGHVWDEDLRELNNPLPRWWMGLFVITIVFSLAYLVFYPGLGSFAGTLGWSQKAQYENEVQQARAQEAPIYERFGALAPEALVADAQAMRIGERLYINNCAPCHGSDARGSKGFPNLTDADWLWGGSHERIVETIAQGRRGTMPPMAAAVGSSEDVRNVAHHVLSLSGSAHNPIYAQLGRGKFAACAACHGPEGKGNTALGAPNLTDKVWLHGWGEQAIVEAIQRGRSNHMPAHADKLTPEQIRVLAAYVASLSQPPGRTAIVSVNSAAPVTVFLYEKTPKLYPRSVDGRFARWRWGLVWLTQIVFYGLPWLAWNGRQAVLFDLEARRFYILGLVLHPQDFIYLTAVLVLSALGLFLFTAVAGRLWCGYACPQTVYTEVFLWVERRIEGDRIARMRLDAAPCGWNRLARKTAKHAAWLAIALWTGITFVGYFTPIRQLLGNATALGLGPWESFWALFYGLATYGNAGFMREQVCKYMCPYARFQSAMFDRDTLIIGYDGQRGEPRGSRAKSVDPRALGLGDCVDCTLCVQVCPTGIDIRKGLQYECIGCAACIDVCDQVMDKVGYPRGLIRYATQNGIEQGASAARMLRRVLRPRVLVYGGILLAVAVAFAASLALRSPFKVDVVRDRGTLARLVDDGRIENVYRLQVMNATERIQRYAVSVYGLPGIETVAAAPAEVGPAQARWVPVRVQLPHDAAVLRAGTSSPIVFRIERLGDGDDPASVVQERSTFIVPR